MGRESENKGPQAPSALGMLVLPLMSSFISIAWRLHPDPLIEV